MEWPGWTPNGALLRDFQSFFLDGEDGRSSVGLRQNVGMVVKPHFCPLRNGELDDLVAHNTLDSDKHWLSHCRVSAGVSQC